MYLKKPPFSGGSVSLSRIELLTSCLSSKRSKPAELKTRVYFEDKETICKIKIFP